MIDPNLGLTAGIMAIMGSASLYFDKVRNFVVQYILRLCSFLVTKVSTTGIDITAYMRMLTYIHRQGFRPVYLTKNSRTYIFHSDYPIQERRNEETVVFQSHAHVRVWRKGGVFIYVAEETFKDVKGIAIYIIPVIGKSPWKEASDFLVGLADFDLWITKKTRTTTLNRFYISMETGSRLANSKLNIKRNSTLEQEVPTSPQGQVLSDAGYAGRGSLNFSELISNRNVPITAMAFPHLGSFMDPINKNKEELIRNHYNSPTKEEEDKKSIKSKLALPPDGESLLMDIKRWTSSWEWYRERDLPWRMGVILYGPPGTGKTTFIRLLGRELNMPIYSWDLASMTCNDFRDAFKRCANNGPSILALEDFHSVFDGQKNTTANRDTYDSALNFQTILNTMDGLTDNNGVLTIITTNDITRMDPALGTIDHNGRVIGRPGRIEKMVQFGYLSNEGKEKIARRILDGLPEEIIKDVIDKMLDDNVTGDQMESVCKRTALNWFWDHQKTNK